MTYGTSGVISQVVGFFLLPLYTSYLTPKDYGVLALLTYISVFFVPMASLGITNAIFRRYNVANEEEDRVISLSTGFWTVVGISCALFILAWLNAEAISGFLLGSKEYAYFVFLVLLVSLITSVDGVVNATLRAKRKVKQIATMRVVKVLVAISSTILFVVVYDLGIAGVLYGQIVGELVILIILTHSTTRFIRFQLSLIELKALLNYGLPFLPHRLFTYGANFLAIYLIRRFIGLEEAGLFDIAVRFTLPVTFIMGAVQFSWVPLKFQIHKEEGDNAPYVFRRLISFYFYVITILVVGVIIVGPELLRLMTDQQFHEGVYLLPFAALIPFTRACYFMMGTGMELTDNTKSIPLISGAGVLTLLLTWAMLLILPYSGIYIILAGLIGSNVVMSALNRYISTRKFFIPIDMRFFYQLSVIVTATAALVWTMQYVVDLPWRIVMEIGLGLSVLLIMLYVLMGKKDLEINQLMNYPVVQRLDPVIRKVKHFFKK